MSAVYAMIPARGGSRGIPRKNLTDLAGRPLIAHAIASAVACPSIDRVMVSTEDEEIAAVSREWGAEVPFRRPEALATDGATGDAVSGHWLKWLADEGHEPWAVVHLQATSPLRTSEDIASAIALLERVECDCVASVNAVTEHPAYMYRVVGDRAEPYLDASALPSHRQQVEPLYRLNGAIFATRFERALAAGKFFVQPFAAYTMPADRSIDVDTPMDLAMANAILSRQSACGVGGGG